MEKPTLESHILSKPATGTRRPFAASNRAIPRTVLRDVDEVIMNGRSPVPHGNRLPFP